MCAQSSVCVAHDIHRAQALATMQCKSWRCDGPPSCLGGSSVEYKFIQNHFHPKRETFIPIPLSSQYHFHVRTTANNTTGWWQKQYCPCLCEGFAGDAFTQTRLMPVFRVSTGLHMKVFGAARVSHHSPRTPNVHISGPRRFKHHQN